jgi:hypothetical protein
MISVPFRGFIAAVLAVFLPLLSACSVLNRLPPTDRISAQRDVDSALLNISHTNSTLSSFKGIGRIRLWDSDKPTLSERVAWIGSLPNKLAMAVLVSGRPVVKIAADGRHFYAVDLQDPGGSYRKIRTSEPRLDRLIRIPVTVGDIATLLAGRTPIRDYNRAFLQKTASGEEVILVLEKWWSVKQKIYLSEDLQTVLRFEIFGSDGTLLYQVESIDTQEFQGYWVPARLRFSTDSGTVLQLDIERFVANVPVTPAMFVLQPPDSPKP